MNIRDLKYLVAVAQTRHFGRAAERCFVSQPTLSTQLKKLEDTLGVILFERTNKSVMITIVGQEIVNQAKEVLASVNKITQLAQNSKDPFAGPYRIGIIPTLGPYLLPHILPAIKKTLPNIELIIAENKTENVMAQLRAGTMDAVILALPLKTEGLVVQELFREPFYIALPKSHPLASKKKLSMKELENESLLLLEEGHCLREQALEACQFALNQQSLGFSATSLETLRQIVGLGAGITFLPALAVKSSKLDKNIVIRPFSGAAPARSIGMLWRGSSVREQCSQEIVKLIQKQVKLCPEMLDVERKKVLTNPLD